MTSARVGGTVGGGFGVGVGTVLGLILVLDGSAGYGFGQVEEQVAAAEVDAAFLSELKADSGARASLLQGGGAGYVNGRPSIYDESKANLLWVGGHIHARYVQNYRDEESTAQENDDFTHGFQLRRARLRLGGNVWDKNFAYQLQIDANRTEGAWTLLDAAGQYKWDNGWAVRFGQFKVPLLREELVIDFDQLAVDPSIVHSVFTQGRSQIVQLEYTTKSMRVVGAVSDGIQTLNTDFDSARESDYALTGRVEWMWAGTDFKRFNDFTSFPDQTYAGMWGVAGHYQSGGETGGTLDRNQFTGLTDLQIEGPGWNAFTTGIWRHSEDDSTTDQESFDDFGFVVQGGVFVGEQMEIFSRYDVLWIDGDRTGLPDGQDSFNTVTAGVNYYLSPNSQAVKFTGDLTYYFDALADVEVIRSSTSTNLLSDVEEGQVGLRLQMQIIF